MKNLKNVLRKRDTCLQKFHNEGTLNIKKSRSSRINNFVHVIVLFVARFSYTAVVAAATDIALIFFISAGLVFDNIAMLALSLVLAALLSSLLRSKIEWIAIEILNMQTKAFLTLFFAMAFAFKFAYYNLFCSYIVIHPDFAFTTASVFISIAINILEVGVLSLIILRILYGLYKFFFNKRCHED